MKQIVLTRGLFALVDDEDYEFVCQWVWKAQPDRVGYYAARLVYKPLLKQNRLLFLHRVILERMGVFREGLFGHHKNGDKLDNQRSNLMAVTRAQNAQSIRHKPSTKTSRFRGVHFHRDSGRWVAHLVANGVKHVRYYIETEEEAARAYNEFAKQHCGDFAHLNCV